MKLYKTYGLTEEQYNDLVSPYQIIIKHLLENQPAIILDNKELIDTLIKEGVDINSLKYI